jgi:hypothetical protein
MFPLERSRGINKIVGSGFISKLKKIGFCRILPPTLFIDLLKASQRPFKDLLTAS